MVIEGAKDCSYAVLDEHCEETGININSMIECVLFDCFSAIFRRTIAG